ncbi:hypothetical protein CI610_02974 [invertebrate metagenome]|uniref:Uncharacterized protein n=1 Tax=invertebrate metagenome TaxID=1711999 RepID=A0A2H9T4G4_9ZZZZ
MNFHYGNPGKNTENNPVLSIICLVGRVCVLIILRMVCYLRPPVICLLSHYSLKRFCPNFAKGYIIQFLLILSPSFPRGLHNSLKVWEANGLQGQILNINSQQKNFNRLRRFHAIEKRKNRKKYCLPMTH